MIQHYSIIDNNINKGKVERSLYGKSLTEKLHLKSQFHKLKIKEDENIMEHLDVFISVLDQLRKVDVKIEE